MPGYVSSSIVAIGLVIEYTFCCPVESRWLVGVVIDNRLLVSVIPCVWF